MTERGATYTEAHRHQCEANYVFALRRKDRSQALAYLELVEKRRGTEAAQALKEAAAALWAAKQ